MGSCPLPITPVNTMSPGASTVCDFAELVIKNRTNKNSKSVLSEDVRKKFIAKLLKNYRRGEIDPPDYLFVKFEKISGY